MHRLMLFFAANALMFLGKHEIERLNNQPKLFISETDTIVEQVFSTLIEVPLSNTSIKTIGPELIFGRIYDYIGFNKIQEELFWYLVIARLAYPLS